jgi:hypothetical protein
MAITLVQPDISYHPDFKKYQLRTERIKAHLPANTTIPTGFPKELKGPLVWEGKYFTEERDWTVSVNETQLHEIHQALIYFKCEKSSLRVSSNSNKIITALNKPIGHVNQTTFPLPTLSPLLRQHAKELSSGRGFFVLRGLTPDKYTTEENVIIYTGVSSYIGSIRGRQDSKIIDGVKQSSMLNHIKDLSQTSVAANIGAPAYTTDKQVFHTDAGDIVSLFCLSPAAKGGESKLASSWRVYNELAKTRPDIIKTLSENWVFDG